VQERKIETSVGACVLGWLLPGAGHLYLGRRGRGIVFMSAVLLLFTLGVLMGSGLEVHTGFDDILAVLLSVAQIAAGLPYLLARGLGFGAGSVEALKLPTYEYGNTFTAVAGLLNILIILDAHDIAVGRKK
jgi:TM2 domain-containing membrane protein YozV